MTVSNGFGSASSVPVTVTVDATAPADSNCDGFINPLDIDPFILALTNRPAWEATYPCNYLCANDVNRDGAVNPLDIDPFIAALTAP